MSVGAGGGVRYATLGSDAVPTFNAISGTTTNKPGNIRYVNIYNGQIYASTEKSTNGIYAIAIGEPTTAGQVKTLTVPAGGPTAPVFSVLQAGNTNVDTLYYVDDGSGSDAAGIYKFSLVDSNLCSEGTNCNPVMIGAGFYRVGITQPSTQRPDGGGKQSHLRARPKQWANNQSRPAFTTR